MNTSQSFVILGYNLGACLSYLIFFDRVMVTSRYSPLLLGLNKDRCEKYNCFKPVFTYSKLTIELLEQGVKYFQS